MTYLLSAVNYESCNFKKNNYGKMLIIQSPVGVGLALTFLIVFVIVLAGTGVRFKEFICGYWSKVTTDVATADTDTASTESSTVEAGTESQATANSTTEDGTDTTHELQEQAIESIDRAERAAEYADYEMAVESYEEALTQLEKAAAEAANPDVEEEVEATLTETEAALDNITTRREHRDSIATTLQAAERSFKEAIARYAAAEQTVARIRFRQARDAFEETQQAIDDSDAEVLAQPIDVSFEEEETLSSMAFEELAVLNESTVEALAAVDIESITHLDAENGEMIPSVVSDLKESDEISSEEAALLTILSWWYEGVGREFTTETEISWRYEQADYGFNQST